MSPQKWLAEGISTYALAFFGILSVVLSVSIFGDGLSLEGILFISLTHGGIVGGMIYVFGHISGAHINPAVTIPMIITRQLSVVDGLGYIGSQLAGATLGAISVIILLPRFVGDAGFGTHPGPTALIDNSVTSGILVEIILTFFLVLTIFMVAVHKKASPGWAGFSIGTVLFLIHMVGVPLTGASVNPARSFGPALASGIWEFQWMYWVAPIIGGILGGVVAKYIFMNKNQSPEMS